MFPPGLVLLLASKIPARTLQNCHKNLRFNIFSLYVYIYSIYIRTLNGRGATTEYKLDKDKSWLREVNNVANSVCQAHQSAWTSANHLWPSQGAKCATKRRVVTYFISQFTSNYQILTFFYLLKIAANTVDWFTMFHVTVVFTKSKNLFTQIIKLTWAIRSWIFMITTRYSKFEDCQLKTAQFISDVFLALSRYF